MGTDPTRKPASYRVSDLVIDEGSRRVTRNGETLRLGGLTFDLLVALVECAPNLVSHDELAERVWKGRPVTPETIAQRAKMLREALSDDARAPRYFEPVRGQGYRLCPNVEPESISTSKPPSRRIRFAAFAGLTAIAIVLIGVWLLFDGSRARPSVAVLPFTDLSEQGDQRYFADGVAEELINTLSKLDGLEVVSRTSSFAFRDPTDDARSIGRKLNVTAILEGSVRKSADALRITVQLIDVASGFHLWSENFDRRRPEDIFDIQDEISASVAGVLGVRLGVGGVNEFFGAGTRNFEAYEAYLRGDYGGAIRLDPNYAAAWARQGVQIASTMWENPPEGAPAIIEDAYAHVLKAIELDPESGHAYGEFATLIYATMDWEAAQRSFDEALERRRDTRNLRNYSNMLARAGRMNAALEVRGEIVRPEPPISRAPSAFNLEVALGNFDLAREANLLLDDPLRSTQNAMVLALHDGSPPEVRAAVEKMAATNAVYAEAYGPLPDALDSPETALTYLRSLVDDDDIVWPDKYHDIALLAAYLGDAELAFDAFSNEIRNTTIRFFALWYPIMSDMRRLPEFSEFVRDVNLVDYWRRHGWSDYCRPVSLEEFVCE